MPKAEGVIWAAATTVSLACVECGVEFVRTGRAQRYCVTCAKQRNTARSYTYEVKSGRITLPGVGSGNGAGKGKDHYAWKNGIALYRQHTKTACERCGSTRFLCAHHKDHNRENNEADNIETVCKSCHQKEHKAANHLNVYTPERRAFLSRHGKDFIVTRKRDARGRLLPEGAGRAS